MNVSFDQPAPNKSLAPLGPRDVMDGLSIISTLIQNGGGELLAELTSGGKASKADKMDIGLRAFSLVTEHAAEPLYQIAARVRGQTVEEFDQEPAVELLRTVVAIAKDERNQDFFTSARSMLRAS